MKIGILVGSLRKGSWNRKLANEIMELLDVESYIIDLSDMPFYNQDLDGDKPAKEYQRLREDIKNCDGFIFITPEYNRSLAPVLKNAIDIGSRGVEGNLWDKKPATVFSSTMGSMGAVSGNLALKQAFNYINLISMNQPEVYLSKIHELFDKDGVLVQDTREFVKSACNSFVEFAQKING